MRGTRAIIHLENLAYNLRGIKRLAGEGVLVCLPVKANAYGHGAVPVAKKALQCGVNVLSVATVDEGVELRNAGIDAPILLFSIPAENELETLVRARLTPFVSDAAFVRKLQQAADSVSRGIESEGENGKHGGDGTSGEFAPLSVHMKIETGMGRTGCAPEDACALADAIAASPRLRLGGVATHFAVSDSTEAEDIAFTKRQIEIFSRTVDALRGTGFEPGIVHAAASGGLLLHPEARFSMVRPGILAYGYPPSASVKDLLELKPVMELRGEVVFVKEVKRGTSVSYGRTWSASADCRIATVCAGYADGIRRCLSPGLQVEIAGQPFPVRGRICMDQFMVELPPRSPSGTAPADAVQAGSSVGIFGPPPCLFSAADLAEIAGTIPYEITCGISARVPRVYTDTAPGSEQDAGTVC